MKRRVRRVLKGMFWVLLGLVCTLLAFVPFGTFIGLGIYLFFSLVDEFFGTHLEAQMGEILDCLRLGAKNLFHRKQTSSGQTAVGFEEAVEQTELNT